MLNLIKNIFCKPSSIEMEPKKDEEPEKTPEDYPEFVCKVEGTFASPLEKAKVKEEASKVMKFCINQNVCPDCGEDLIEYYGSWEDGVYCPKCCKKAVMEEYD